MLSDDDNCYGWWACFFDRLRPELSQKWFDCHAAKIPRHFQKVPLNPPPVDHFFKTVWQRGGVAPCTYVFVSILGFTCFYISKYKIIRNKRSYINSRDATCRTCLLFSIFFNRGSKSRNVIDVIDTLCFSDTCTKPNCLCIITSKV